MYIPKAFEVTDTDRLFQFMRHHSFGILFSQSHNTPFATHLPFLVNQNRGDNGSLFSHMAKANPHWRTLNQQDVLVVFPGPHAFVSSLWYGEEHVVPTWNYTAVHVVGTFHVLDDRDELKQLMVDSLNVFEPKSTVSSRLDQPFFDGMLNAIVGFRIDIKAIEGKWKLSQNHSVERQQKVIDALYATNDPHAHDIARLMKQNLETRT